MGDDLAAVYRREVGRCTATLIRVLGDVDLAEDAVAEAFAVAAQRWPASGIPPNPGGWITTRRPATGRSTGSAGRRPARTATSPPTDSTTITWNPTTDATSTTSTPSSTSSPTSEAIRLARVLVELMPDEPEATGLVSPSCC